MSFCVCASAFFVVKMCSCTYFAFHNKFLLIPDFLWRCLPWRRSLFGDTITLKFQLVIKLSLVNTYLIVEVYFSFGVKVCPFGLLFSLGKFFSFRMIFHLGFQDPLV